MLIVPVAILALAIQNVSVSATVSIKSLHSVRLVEYLIFISFRPLGARDSLRDRADLFTQLYAAPLVDPKKGQGLDHSSKDAVFYNRHCFDCTPVSMFKQIRILITWY